MSEKGKNELPAIEYDAVVEPPTIGSLHADIRDLLINFSIQEDKLRRMANQLEDHMHKPDAHNPGILRKK